MKTKKIISWAVALCMGVMLHSCDLDQKSIFEPDKFKLPTDGGRHRCIGNRHVCQFQGQFRWCV